MKTYQAVKNVSCRIEEPEGALLFHRETEMLRVINPSGLMIWESIAEPVTIDQLVENLLDTGLDASKDELKHDATDFLDDLIVAGMVTVKRNNDDD